MYSINKYHKLILSLVVFIFIIAANYAWLNPHPDSKVHKTIDNIPFFWQYNDDAGIEIVTAAYFPEIFNTYKSRMDRPTYPVIVKVLGETIGLFAEPFKELTKLEKAGAGYLMLKLIIFSIFSFCAFNIYKKYFPQQYALFTVFLLIAHYFSIKAFAMFHTQELQFITPTIIIYFFLKLYDRYSHSKNIYFSIIVGSLMLGKPNYAIYLSLLVYCLINKKFYESFVSFSSHLIPFATYLIFLKINNFNFFSSTVIDHNQGTWFLNAEFLSINYITKLLISSLSNFSINIIQYYHIILIFFFIGIFMRLNKKNNKFILFLSILIFFTWFQEFFSNRYRAYMTADLSILIFGFSTYAIYEFTKNVSFKIKILMTLSIIWILLNLLILANFPWIHPNNHEERDREVSENRIFMIENHHLYNRNDIKLNSKQNIFEPKSIE